jgi:hypothetical protein
MIYKLFNLIVGHDMSAVNVVEQRERKQTRPLYKNINYIFIEIVFLQKYIKKKIIIHILKSVISYLQIIHCAYSIY